MAEHEIESGGASPTLLVHGGAGVIRRDMDAATERAVRDELANALRRGHAELAAGGSALDAVAAAVTVLEDAPYFNAGRGAVFTHDGTNELDAAIMDGATLRAGAIAGVRHVRNPVLLARAVMEHSDHVMLAGAGAEAFARTQDIALVDPAYFRTDKRWQQLQEALQRVASGEPVNHFGTVGAVALDAQGRLAAATSTGGMTDKRWGRIGDAPVIGAGTYANAACAMSGTGWGEFYIRTAAAHAVCMRVAVLHQPLTAAARDVINREIPALGGSGGAIVLGADGMFAMPFNTDGMYRGHIRVDGEPHVAIWPDEDARAQ
ncbi:MAG TPA: isoaspartyl peptidase/L-asparaginase [Rhodanobacteraceae bacterium]|nr:isoaspartyl peptidase/L-asparaginase [Rhodanobacteraceae bacterium]